MPRLQKELSTMATSPKQHRRTSLPLPESAISRVKLLDDPKQIARKRFMAFLSSLRSIVKHTKSRHLSDHQEVFKLDFKKRWPPIKKNSLCICISVDSNSLRPVYMLQLFLFINIFIQLPFVILIKVYDYIENKIMT